MVCDRRVKKCVSCWAVAAVIVALAGRSACLAEFIWLEGEAPKTQNMTRHPWWYDKVKRDLLSGGDFISNWSDKQPGEAAYAFDVPTEKEYALWVRANPVAVKLSYQLDGGEWKPIDMAGEQVDVVNIAEDEKVDLRYLAWARAGAFKLTRGPHTIAFRMHSENNNHGMLDCFVFTAEPFTPNGTLKPGEKLVVKAEEGRWAFRPARDEFSPDALLDLRPLNEKVAGESGYVTRTKDGNDFLLGNGQPARFWAVNTGAYNKHPLFPAPDLARHARFLAKRGINMVRFHGNITPKGTDLMDIDREERDKLWRLVAAMKKEGIYTTFSPYWAGASRTKPEMGYLDDGGNHNWGLLFFDKKLQDAYKNWMKLVLTEKNPYTGIPLAQDPALAIIQLQNEDSLLFYTSQRIKGAAKAELRRQFGEFLKKKYGSLEQAREAWKGAAPPPDQDSPDDFAKGEAALMIVWELGERRFGADFQRRCTDTMQFFAETMYNFNKMMGDYIHNELGCKALINAGNWRTANNVLQLDAERWSYSANEVMGVNRYYGGAHDGRYAGWAIVNGDRFTDESALLNPRALPLTLKQVEGYPMIIPESSWVPPLGYQSEGPFLTAAYQSLTGVDALYWFATGEEDWRQPSSANGYLPSEGKWVCATPMLMGQWPAAALLYRMGYVKRGEPVVYEQRSLDDLWERRMPIIAEDAGYDPNRDKDFISRESNIKDGVDPLAYLVGPVLVKYGGDPSKSKVTDLKPYIDSAKKTIKSITGELEMDYGKGLCTLNAPKAQGVSGFLNKVGSFKLADVVIRSGNDYATVLVVSMDDKPLRTSGKVLVQVGTTERPTGWKTRPAKLGSRDGEEVVSFGKAPWQIVQADVRIAIANGVVKKAHVLDPNGMPVKDIGLATEEPGVQAFSFPPDALYVVLE